MKNIILFIVVFILVFCSLLFKSENPPNKIYFSKEEFSPLKGYAFGKDYGNIKLMSREKEIQLLSKVPLTDNDKLNKIIYDPRIIVYTREEIPNYYYHNGAFKYAKYDIGPIDAPKAHNGSREFPWNEAGGTHRCSNAKTFKFMWLPKNKKIKYKKRKLLQVLSISDKVNMGYNDELGYVWTFPIGTIFGEVHLMQAPDGNLYCYEIRLRIKETKDDWGVDLYRPFPNYKDLLKALPKDNPVAKYLSNPPKTEIKRLADVRHIDKMAIDVTAGVDVLPDFKDNKLVKRLLTTTTFKSALGETWRKDCFAPTTNSDFSIIPKNYDGTFLGTDRVSCANCHNSAGQDTSVFHFGRDWYGFIKGSQAEPILSFGIHDPVFLVKDASRGIVKLHPKLLPILERDEK